MTRKTLLKPIPSSSTTQLYEPIEVIQFAMKKLTLPKITILQQLLDREIIFDAKEYTEKNLVDGKSANNHL
jgi:hypothetical protein